MKVQHVRFSPPLSVLGNNASMWQWLCRQIAATLGPEEHRYTLTEFEWGMNAEGVRSDLLVTLLVERDAPGPDAWSRDDGPRSAREEESHGVAE